jgi:hypothetical protein
MTGAPAHGATGAPALSLVVTTVGRPREFARLLRSVTADDAAGSVELVLVDQSPERSCARVLEEAGAGPLARTAVTTSGRGAARGRNAGLALATAPLVGFPDDNCWYPPGALAQVLRAFAADPALACLSGRQATEDGRPSMLRWLPSPAPVTRRNFMRTTIMSTMFFSRPAVDAAGGFDESMGVGSAGWFGAGEESDLLLKVLDAGGRARYDPELTVLQDEPRDAVDEAFVAKMLRYGCGMGHLWRLHRLPLDQFAWYSARKAAAVLVRGASGRAALARADAAYLRGTLAGYTGRPPRALRDLAAPR